MKKSKFKKQKSEPQVEEESFFEFRPCRVKINRLKFPKSSEISQVHETESPSPQKTLRSSFRNPALALTTRRAEELKSQKRIHSEVEGYSQLGDPIAIVSEKRPNIIEAKKPRRFKQQKQKENNKEINEKDDIYEFLSQSQTSISDSETNKHRDPAADIIKKLIERGKVAVTKNYKGKPVIVHKKTSRKTNKNKTNKKMCRALTKNSKRIPLEKQFQPTDDVIIEMDEHFDDATHDGDTNVDFIPPMSVANEYPNATILNMSNIASTSNNQASFSTLARSVLMQQMNNNKSIRRTISDISTPLRKAPIPLQTVDIDLSPIPKTTAPNKDKTSTFRTCLEPNNFENDVSFVPSLPNEISNNLNASRTVQDATVQQNSLSSFSSNDSNAENMPPLPPTNLAISASNNENSNRRTLNTRRTLPNRQPLKQLVNIIDVLELPPYKHPIEKAKEDSKLFGFEEYLDEDQNELNEDGNNNNNNNTKNTTIQKLRKRLKKLRPTVKRSSESKRSTITRNIFDDDFNKKKGQRDIRNMFCSTMCQAPENTTKSIVGSDSTDTDDSLPTTSRKNDAVDLFGDPESTFDQKILQRTYERPFKRKRKLQHQYAVCLDSEDESEGEVYDKKRKKREESPNPDLEIFVSQFNSMIKEAEDYELIVE